MKYMLMVFGDAATMMETRSPEWITEMFGFMQQLDAELTDSVELVFQLGLTDGSTAEVVSIENGIPVTNVVEHSKHVVRGKRRIHRKLDLEQIRACVPWLGAELARIRPEVLILLGAQPLRPSSDGAPR